MDNKQIQTDDRMLELDLQAAISILLRYKWLVLALTAGAALAAFALSSAIPKIYLIKTTLQIGTVANIDGTFWPIESKNQLKDKLDNGVYGYLVRKKTGISSRDYSRVSMKEGESQSIISLSIESSQVDEAKKILDEINAIIIAEHARVYDMASQNLSALAESEANSQKKMEDNLFSLEAKKKLADSRSALQAGAGSLSGIEKELVSQNARIEIENINQDINYLYLRMEEAKKGLFAAKSRLINIAPTQIVEPPHSSEEPILPRMMLNTLLGALFGFFVSLAIVCLMANRRYN